MGIAQSANRFPAAPLEPCPLERSEAKSRDLLSSKSPRLCHVLSIPKIVAQAVTGVHLLRMRALAYIVLLFGLYGFAQRTPVLRSGSVPYPPIARAAHVSGDAQVSFRIEQDGTVGSVVEGSGPAMLVKPLALAVSQWKFETPLPIDAPIEWTAAFHYGINDSDKDDLEDTVDGPPWYPCCGDVIMLDTAQVNLRGTIRSDSGAQIDWQQAALPSNPCPAKTPMPSSRTNQEDSIELDRRGFYSVRVYRGGRIEWTGIEGVDAIGARQGSLTSAAADRLFAIFDKPDFWAKCGLPLPPERDSDGDLNLGVYLTAHFGESQITVRGDEAQKETWALESAANTHQWRHGDVVSELPRNIEDDLHYPKPGITALMRAVDHYNRYKAQWTDAALKYQLAHNPDLEATDASGWTALAYAAALHSGCCDHNPAVSLLLAAHADVDHASFHGDTPLMLAAYFGNLNEDLLKAGADINHRNADGVTTLMLLAQQENSVDIAAALQAGADPAARDAHDRTALDYLREASCDRAIVSLPIPYMSLGSKACPSRSDRYQETRILLERAMKHGAARTPDDR